MEIQEKRSYMQSSTPMDTVNRQVSASSLVEKTEGRMSHLRVALEFGEEITEEELNEPYRNNPLRYIALRICIIAILVVIAVLARKRFLDLQDFTGATAHTTSCLLMPLIILHARVLEEHVDHGQGCVDYCDYCVRFHGLLRDDPRRRAPVRPVG
ncbi:hypothetical protein Pcac1_g15868 [Phytophthora cactorum]|nr:hypothetical protein Pcac1_g15868 [Phytophthora cactorum]